MALVPYRLPDQNQMIEDTITTQFRDQPVVYKYLRLWVEELHECFITFQSLAQDRDIDSATGDALDIIGRIVGQERTIVGGDLYNFFGFRGHLQARGFGDKYVEGVGGMWWSLGAPMGGDVTMTDEQYRVAIKARIMRNNSRGTSEDMLKYIKFVFGVNGKFTWNEGGVARVGVGRKLTNFEKALIAAEFSFQKYPTYYSPKPLGVTLELFEFDSVGTLGFIGTPGAKGMISLSTPNPDGGIFATIKYFDEIPTNPPDFEVDFQKDANLPSYLNFERTSRGTYTGPDGFIKTAEANIPRFNYQRSGVFRGLMLEEARTNLLLHSEDYTQTAWQKGSAVVVTPTSVSSPTGQVTASKYVSSGSLVTENRMQQFVATSVAAGTLGVFSVWLRADAPVSTTIRIANQGDGDGVNLNVELTTQWQRFEVSRVFTAASAQIRCVINTSLTPLTMYVWGAQLELAANTSSYITTTTATVTRAADRAWSTPLALPSAGFTAYVECTRQDVTGFYPLNFSNSPTATGSYVGFRFTPSTFYVNSAEGIRTNPITIPGIDEKTRAAFCTSNVPALNRGAVNGVVSTERVITPAPVDFSARNIMKLGATANTAQGLWHIQKFSIYNTMFSDEQLNYLTYSQ